ncbi:MAG: hypothetical protein ACR2QO_06045 [Acidimicrobiales bacterium]
MSEKVTNITRPGLVLIMRHGRMRRLPLPRRSTSHPDFTARPMAPTTPNRI